MNDSSNERDGKKLGIIYYYKYLYYLWGGIVLFKNGYKLIVKVYHKIHIKCHRQSK